MKTNKFLSRLMKLSWEIQRTKRVNRAKALLSAWVIVQNANLTVFYLVERFSNKKNKQLNRVNPHNLTLSLTA